MKGARQTCGSRISLFIFEWLEARLLMGYHKMNFNYMMAGTDLNVIDRQRDMGRRTQKWNA